jgi:hypothetical protein
MQPVVFSAAWFAKHQRVLLTLLRLPVIGLALRQVLAIRPHDVGWNRRIVQIAPHSYTVQNDDGTLTTDFRTHAKYGKRLYYELLPVWQAAHAWDQYVANRLVPALNLGFDTLTVYPDASPGVTSGSWFVRRQGVDESWATIRAGAGNDGFSPTSWQVIEITASATSNQWASLGRSIFTFDTSALTASAVISAATLSLFVSSVRDDDALVPNVDMYAATPTSNTAETNSDFGQIGTTSLTGAPIAYGSFSTAAYNAFSLNGTGIAAISAVGISRFGARNASYDVANSAPATWTSGHSSYVAAYFADQAGSANDPKLVVTYTIPVNPLITLLGTASV